MSDALSAYVDAIVWVSVCCYWSVQAIL